MNIRNSKRLRIAVYIQAALQVMLPLQASWANSPVSLPRPTVINLELTSVDSARKEADLISRNYFKRGYTLASGDTLNNVAKTARVSLLTLREINRIHIPADKKFYALKAGDYLMIPDWDRPLDENAAPAVLPAASTQAAPPAQNENNSTDQRTASALNGLGSALQSKDQSSAARALAVGTATGAAAQSVQEWMNQFGNARVNLSVDDHLRYSGASADVLLPLTDKEAKNLAFTQLGVTDKDHYTTVNLGVGQRHFTDDAMLGYNLFIDQELRNQHTRLGVGAEYWRDFMKFAGNIYTGITSWKESKQLEDYEERPATGFDLRAEAWLPSMPQVGGKLKLEQYFGDEVGLISASDRQKDPLAITMGVNYTPVSLFTAGIDQRFSNGKSDTQFNLQFNYEIGTPLSQQLDPEYVKERRTLAGSRLDFVDRNNAMVMEYRKMEVIKLSLPPVLAGKTAQSHSITGTVKARHGLKHIDWDTSALQAAGARVTASKNNVLTMTLPTSPGTYPLTAIAWDKKGNASNTASMTVEVSPDSTQPGHQISHLQAQPLQQKANGVDVITYTLRATAPDGTAAKNTRVLWSTDKGVIQQPETRTNDAGESTTTLFSTDHGKVNLNAVLLDEQGNKLIDRVHKDAEFIIAKNVLTLTADKPSAKADGNDAITFTYTAKDDAGQPIADREIAWSNLDNLGVMTPASQKTDANGEAKATLISQTQGATRLAVALKNTDGTDGQNTESQPVNFTLNIAATLTEDKTQAISDGNDVITLSYQAKDGNGQPLANYDLQWETSPVLGDLTPQAAKTDKDGKATATLSSQRNGATVVSATLLDPQGSPLAKQSTNTLTFAQAGQLTLNADKLTAKANGTDVITFTYKALDSSGKPLTGRPVSWNKGTAIGDLTPVDNQTNAQGEAKATLKSLVKGITHVEAVLKNADGTEHARTKSQDVEFQLGNIATVTADKNSALADGVDTITLSYHVEDELGNPVDNADIDWSMSPQLGALTTAATKTDGSGNASAKLVSNAVGDTTITVTLKDTGEQQNSPRVTFDQSATLTLSADKASAKADGTEAITFTYTATDKTGKPLASRQIIWDNTNNLGTLTRSDTVTDNSGKAMAVLVSTADGRTSLGVSLKNADGSDHKRTQSGEVEFVRGTIVSVNPDKTSALADGYETILFTFEAKDDQNNPITGADIEWSSQGSFGNLQPDSLKTDSTGKATAKLTSIQTGSTRVTVKLIDKDIPATSTQVTFDKSALIVLDADKSSAQADGSDTITFTYKVTDRVGTPLAGRDVVWSNTTAIGNMVPVSSRTNAQGEASATLTSTQAGQTALSVLLKNADGSNYDTKTSSQVSFATVAPFVVALSSDHNQSWATNSHKRTLSMLVTQSGQPVSGKDLAWDMSSCTSCNVDNANPVSDAQGKASAQFSSTAAGQQTIKICLKDDPTVCGNVNVDVLEIPTLEYRTKGSTGWNSGNWSGKPLLKEGEIELKVNNASGNITWTPSSGITLNNATSTPTATLVAPAATMKIDYELFSSEPKMKLSQQFALNGTPVLRPGAPQLLNYQDAINACQAIGASQVDESIAGTVYSTWGNIANVGNYGAVFSPWLNGSLGTVPGMQDNAKAMDLRNGSVLTLFNAYSSNTHVLCAQ
ncbi:Ig-like domain-containing protein [Pantoea sp. PNT02]|uniref:Ig-like domain-containing protein n=1 Tax=Pantoea sp. PNT02 TaxID=2769261 RepID=UPI00177D1E99|nr:Ig-like domain-containing protein [Pantoea sp. PNT02]MBD9646339.1 Ig-like domain-containing protein [Pantoea sp. PNT02]